MARRIFRNMVVIAVLAVALTAVLIVPTLYNAHEESMSGALWQEAEAILRALPLAQDQNAYLQSLSTKSRITLIAPDGRVIYDSAANADEMANHAQRPEIQQARQNGSGESIRTSDTLSETILYCARRADDGSILRLGSTRRSMLGTLMSVLPLLVAMLLGVALASLLLARRAAGRIVAPLNQLNLDQPLANETYDELAPLLTRMHRQHELLEKQLHALESARGELAAIMANMREGMILIDQNENVLSINESAARIFEAEAGSAVGRSLLLVNRDADLHELVQQALSGEGGILPLCRGSRRYELYISPVFSGKNVRGVVLLILDVTERFAAEKSRRDFTANVSHELKTPLTSISGFAELIRDGIAQPQDVPRFAGMICRESARLMTLVNDILELSRLDEKQNLSVKEPVALPALLRELAESFSLEAEKKRLTLTVKGQRGTVCGDPVLLRELFLNLLDNAVKYTPEGGFVSATVEEKGDRVICTVSDTGVGIPPEHQPHVFERFYRVDKSHSRQTGGTGLGLAIVKHVAKLHHAHLQLTSTENQGTAVCVEFVAGCGGRDE